MSTTIEQDIAEAEARLNYRRGLVERSQQSLADAEKELADLRAKRDAEARKSEGRRLAEKVVRLHQGAHIAIGHPIDFPDTHFRVLTTQHKPEHMPELVADIQSVVAAAIDQAVADERETCAKLAEGRETYAAPIAEAIRARGKGA